MALITCPECEKQISEDAVSCPNCGFLLTQEIVSRLKEEHHGFHDFFLKAADQELEECSFHDSTNESSPQKPETNLKEVLEKKRRRDIRYLTVTGIVMGLIYFSVSYVFKDVSTSTMKTVDEKELAPSVPKVQPNEQLRRELEENRRIKIDSINIESNRIANVAIGDMPKGSINVDTLMRVYKKIASDSAELGLIYANYLIDLKNELILEGEQKKDQIKWDKTKAGKIQKEHPKWSKEDCEKVANNIIWIGMSIEMLCCERGSPNSANPSNYGDGVHWQWCWSYEHPSCFYGGEDGIITSYN